MLRLQKLLEDSSVWRVVETLANALLAEGHLSGEPLRKILSPLHERVGGSEM
jgi:hypothetical protein